MIPLSKFDADEAIDLWWKSKVWCPNQPPKRKPYKKQQTESSPATDSNTETEESEPDLGTMKNLPIVIMSTHPA